MNIYLVSAFGGRYEDSWEEPVKAFTTYESAKEFIDQCEKEGDEWFVKANRIIDEFMDTNPRVIDIITAMDYVDCAHKINLVELGS